jgi:heme/copper-type cytochrome/quinol oxidase subunit 2
MFNCSTYFRCGVALIVTVATIVTVFVYAMLMGMMIKHRKSHFDGTFFELFMLNAFWDAVSLYLVCVCVCQTKHVSDSYNCNDSGH